MPDHKIHFYLKFFVALLILVVFLWLGRFHLSTTGRAAKKICKKIEQPYDCYLEQAIAQNEPDICWLIGPSEDDGCMQDYFEKKNDAAVCESISKSGVRDNCFDYFRRLELLDLYGRGELGDTSELLDLRY